MRITKRMLLAVLLSIAQLACLVLGLAWFANWLHRDLDRMMRAQVLADNALVASQMAELIEVMGIETLEPESADWERLQSTIETIRLPNDGFLCVVSNETGALVCHPELRHNPDLRKMTPGMSTLASIASPATGESIVNAARDGASASGWARMGDGAHLIGVRDIPRLDVKVLAHQRERGIAAAVARVTGPVWMIGLIVSATLSLLTLVVSASIVHRYENRLAWVNEHLERLVDERTVSLLRTRDAVIFGLAKLAESRDDDTGEHLERIRRYVDLLANELRARRHPELDDRLVTLIGLSSSLHDIGKVGVPDSILLKPARLTDDERRVMQTHTTIGGECLTAIKERLGDDDFLEIACEIAYTHHERWDGAGYPYGLAGEDIPMAGRIVALADVYDALTSKRVYKDAMTHAEAKRIILDGAGSHFDPAVVDAFEAMEADFAEMSAGAQRHASSERRAA
ncbi:MAG: HD-GYP domain-containing protein [Phycisphaerales bacterium]